jgi:hypothetical protein
VEQTGVTVSLDDRIIELFTDAQLAAAPVVYTSYDYAAPLRETRQIRDKLSQTKLIGLFTRVSKDLLKTEMIGNGTGYSVRVFLLADGKTLSILGLFSKCMVMGSAQPRYSSRIYNVTASYI